MLLIRRKIRVRVHPKLAEDIEKILNKYNIFFDKRYYSQIVLEHDICCFYYEGSIRADKLDEFIEDLKLLKGVVGLTY